MDSYFCYSWDNASVSWLNADITWKEACVLNKIATHHNKSGGRFKHSDLTKEDEEILIKLIVRIKENGLIKRVEETKVKNKKIKVSSRDIKLFIKELQEIKLKVIL